MKQFNRKLRGALFICIVCLIAFIGFSRAGLIFSDKNLKVVTVTATERRFDSNRYVAAMKEYSKVEEGETTTTPITTTSTSQVTTTVPTTKQVTQESTENNVQEDTSLAFEGKSVLEVAEVLNKTLGGVLVNQGEAFARLSMEKGMDPYLLVAISIHETGNGTSSAARNKYNFGGLMCSGRLCTYSSVEDGIEKYVNVVYKNYFLQGLTTAETMNKKYAASTSWAMQVNAWYDRIKNK